MTQVTEADRAVAREIFSAISMALARTARHREQAIQEAVAEREARIAELETWQRGILEWLAHECGIGPDELPNHLALQEIDNAVRPD